MYHLFDSGCQVQKPMSGIFFYTHVYVYIEMSPQKVLTPSPHVAVMRLRLNRNRHRTPNETGSQKLGM